MSVLLLLLKIIMEVRAKSAGFVILLWFGQLLTIHNALCSISVLVKLNLLNILELND